MVDSSQHIAFYARGDIRIRLWNCDNNVETRRSIWQSYFLGISGGLEWHLPADLTIYQRVDDFISGVDLEGGKWHSGMMKLDNQDRWEYKKAYRDDCIRDDELADVVYLRSGDRERAFGVITNRRANYYTLGTGNCTDSTAQLPAHSGNNVSGTQELIYTSFLRKYGSLNPFNGDNRLRVRNMKLAKEYKIKYYNPNDLVNSVKEETRWGPQLTLEFPTMGGSDSLDIVLFEVFRIGENFKSVENDTTDLEDIESRISKNEENDNVSIYPNPNDGNFVVFIENPNEVILIRISDNLGKIIDTRTDVKKKNHFNTSILRYTLLKLFSRTGLLERK